MDANSDSTASINPNDFPEVEEWKDGKEYTIRVKQVATGEFQVVSVEQPAPPVEEEVVEEEVEPAPGASRYGNANPAVAAMMDSDAEMV